MKKKNALLTFLFACIPGAGQMYYGYMQRGLSLITMFCLSIGAGVIFEPALIVMPIVWMYSFFDTYDLIRHMAAGEPKPDALLLIGDAANLEELKKLIPQHNKLIGWALIGVGVYALYDNVIVRLLGNLLNKILPYSMSWYYIDTLPKTLFVAGLLIWLGWRLVKPQGQKEQKEELPPFPGENQ